MRKQFSIFLHQEMALNPNIHLLTADLGYGLWDQIQKDYPKRFHNVWSAEQLLIGAGVGMACSGLIPVCYSITSFLIKRPYEFIDLYLNHEKIPVKLLGGGLGRDYGNLGYSHWAENIHALLSPFENIEKFLPETVGATVFREFLYTDKPAFLGLRK